ncbi:MAG: hypothetical protein O3B09_01240 [Proteobacteria bacterium]|nr:hypothetical protein [Pseudomonadota bacterium]
MRNKLLIKILVLALLVSISSCRKVPAEDPLLLPPDFNEMPEINQDGKVKTAPKEVDEDIEDLRDLLLAPDS